MPTNFDLAEAAINFTAGTEATWNAFVLPIPENVVVYTVDTKKFKKGDGNHRFSELEDGPSIAGIASGEETVVNVLTQLEAGDEDSIISISNEIYDASTTKLTTLVARLNALANSNTVQTANMDAAELQFGLVNSGITTSDNGKLAVVIGHDMSAGVLPDTLSVQAPVNPINIRSFKFYADANMTQEVSILNYNSIFYANVHVQHDSADIDDISIALTETNDYVTIEHIERGKFKIIVGMITVPGIIQFTATATYNVDTVTMTEQLTVSNADTVIMSTYGGTGAEEFLGVGVKSDGNIVVVGQNKTSGNGTAILAIFDNSLNIINQYKLDGAYGDNLNTVVIDSSDNIYVVGGSYSLGADPINAMAYIIKFDSNLNILVRKKYDGDAQILLLFDTFISVAVTSDNKVVCVGYTGGDGPGAPSSYYSATIIVFDSSLNILQKKVFGTTVGDTRCVDVVIDSNDNILCCGYSAEGTGNISGFVYKFDTSLTLIARKRYICSTYLYFTSVDVDSNNNVYAVGYTNAEGAGGYDGLIVKFDSNLNIVARKVFGGTGTEHFNGVCVDSQDNIICVGYTTSEGFGGTTWGDALIVKYDSSLNVIFTKLCGGSGNDTFESVTVDSNDNIICVGSTYSEGNGSQDCFIAKFPSNINRGISNGTVFTNIYLSDGANFANVDSALTLETSALTIETINAITLSSLTSLTPAASSYVIERDVFYV